MRSVLLRPTIVLFGAGLALRLLSWLGSPEWSAPWTAIYQGDAPYWQTAAAGTAGIESLLPFRPPAMAWLTRALWDGDPANAVTIRLVMALLGALVAPLVFCGLVAAFPRRVAWIAGWICALSNPLLQLGTGVHGELPYLVLFLLTAPDFVRLARGAAGFCAVRWSVLHAAACMFRVDHVLCWALSLAWLLWRARTQRWRLATLTIGALAAALAPWHWHAAQLVDRFNTHGNGGPIATAPPTVALPWDTDAIAAVRAMPAFTRAATFGFVDATVRTRGGTRVVADDLAVLEEAYGYRPAPLTVPFIALYGPLNFFLANSEESDGTFTRAPLDRRPALAGGPARYPAGLLDALPRDGALELSYPPHLRAINDGYQLGLRWIVDHPGAAAGLVWRRLGSAWRGAAGGLGAASLPVGRAGLRQPVDLTCADGALATNWRLLLLVLAAAGTWRCAHWLRRNPEAGPITATWAAWVLAKVVAVAMFFGYARMGALCVPALALVLGLSIDQILDRMPTVRCKLLLGIALLGIALADVAATRAANPWIDGAATDPARPTAMAHRRVRIDFR